MSHPWNGNIQGQVGRGSERPDLFEMFLIIAGGLD